MKHGKAYEKLLNEYLKDPNKAIEQLESCNYECEAGTLTNNVADGLGEQDFRDFMWESHREVAVEWWKRN